MKFLLKQEQSASEMYVETEGACGGREVSCYIIYYFLSFRGEGGGLLWRYARV